MKRIQIRIALLLVACVFLFSSCKKEEENRPPVLQKTISLRVAFDPEISKPLGSVVDKFLASSPILPDGTLVKIELIPETGLAAAKHLSSGELKTHAWISPSRTLVDYANINRVNLGAEQTNCSNLFQTSLAVAIRQNQEREMSVDSKRQISLRRILARRSAAGDPNSFPDLQIGETMPFYSTSGIAALAQLAYIAAESNPLNQANIVSDTFETSLSQLEGGIGNFQINDAELLSFLSSPTINSEALRLGITTEQQINLYNSTAAPDKKLSKLSPEEGSYALNSCFCISKADWVTIGHQAALKLFQKYLTSPEGLAEFQNYGYSLPPTSDSSQKTITQKADQVNVLPELDGPTFSALIDSWRSVRRPISTILVLDLSGSMEGDPLYSAKIQFRKLLAINAENDEKALIGFSSDVKIYGDLEKDGNKLMSVIDNLNAGGGSAVYDAIRIAIELASRDDVSSHLKRIIVFTDGSDKNSMSSLRGLISYAKESCGKHDIELTIVGLHQPDAQLDDLKQIAEAADGTFNEVSLLDIESIFDRLIKLY